jgi:RNA polymerase sigma-54 factor
MLKQKLSQKLLQKLSPQQIQLMQLIQLPTLAFEQKVKDEMEENPALESGNIKEEANNDNDYLNDGDSQHIDSHDINVDEYLSDDEIPSYKLHTNNYSDSDEEKNIAISSSESLFDNLMSQLNTLNINEQEFVIAEFIIGNLDEDGYLRRDVQAISDDLAFNMNIYTSDQEVESVLLKIQQLDPAGIAARNLQECLLLQLREKENNLELKIAQSIIQNYFEEFTKKHFEKIVEGLEVDIEEIKLALDLISKLNPKPGSTYSSSGKNNEHITPDFTIQVEDGIVSVVLNQRNQPELNISPSYQELFQSYKDSDGNNKELRDAVSFVKQKLDSAKWFIDAIKQRQNTLISTMNTIVRIQHDYFVTGDENDLKPMILKDVAEKVSLDISTISRVVNSKYVSTPYGTKSLKEFFSESMKNKEGEDISTKEIKNKLAEIINSEDKKKPYTDAKLVEKLSEAGYVVARRTVAKYREQLDLPVARLRKEIK